MDTSTLGEREEIGIQHPIRDINDHHYTTHIGFKAILSNTLFCSIYSGHDTNQPLSVVVLFGHCFLQSVGIEHKTKASENSFIRLQAGHIMTG